VTYVLPHVVEDETIRRHAPGGQHFAIDDANAPDESEADRVYALMTRVRSWDANVRAGWMPVGYGRKRMIDPMD
jgi:hypothetical protein